MLLYGHISGTFNFSIEQYVGDMRSSETWRAIRMTSRTKRKKVNITYIKGSDWENYYFWETILRNMRQDTKKKEEQTEISEEDIRPLRHPRIIKVLVPEELSQKC